MAVLDGNRLEAGTVLRAKYCVIGSGMGGSAVATQLAEENRDVLLIEAGGLSTHLESLSSVQAQYAGRPARRPPSRCIELGGTSNLWHGICAPLDDIDFERRPWIPDSGWPIGKRDLQPFYRQAERVHGVTSAEDLEAEATRDNVLRERLKDVEYDASVIAPKLIQFRPSPLRWKSTLLDLAERSRLRLLLHASALELIVEPGGTAVTRLIAGTDAGQVFIEAEVYVLCAGSLETPRLLLNSRSRWTAGIGNAADLVGRNLLEHPSGHFGKLKFRGFHRAPLYAGMSRDGNVTVTAALRLSSDYQERHALPNHYFMIRPTLTNSRIDDELRLSFLAIRGIRDLSLKQVRAIMASPDLLQRALVSRLGMAPIYRYGDLFFFTEQLPNRGSRITLSPDTRDRFNYPIARIGWLLTTADMTGFEAYANALFSSGLNGSRYRLSRRENIGTWEATVASSAHHLGTARMSASPSQGVVDSDLKVHGVANLFVSDGSVFPTSGSTNPSLTITALAFRLAQHLVARDRPALVA